MAQLLAKNP